MGVPASGGAAGSTPGLAAETSSSAAPFAQETSYRLGADALTAAWPHVPVAQVPSVLIVHPSLPVKSVAELITFARRRPHELDYGSSGVGTASHLAAVLFAQRAGLFMTHVPYKGGVPAMYELLGGQISVMFGGLTTAFSNIRNGRTRAETYPGFEYVGWFALFAPAQTSGTVIHKINAETVAMFTQREIRERFLAQGADFSTSTPSELDDRVRREIAKWRGVIRAADIKPMKN